MSARNKETETERERENDNFREGRKEGNKEKVPKLKVRSSH